MQEKRIIIGLVGHPGSGKDTVGNYLIEKYGFSHVSMGDMIRKYVQEHNLGEPVRELLSRLGNELREKFGPDYLVTRALESRDSKLAINGVRNIYEAERIKKEGGIIVSIEAPIEFRYKKALERGREDGTNTFEEFKRIEERESKSKDPNAQSIQDVMNRADFIVQNDSTLEALHQKIDKVIQSLV